MNPLPRPLGVVVALALLLAMGGCGHRFNRTYLAASASFPGIAVVAVLPFENLTDYPNAGDIMADLVATELFAMDRYKVLDAHTALKLYRDVGGVVMPTGDRSFAVELGQKIRADAVVYGSVQEYAYRLDKTRLGAREPAVAITVRMAEVESGLILWAASESRSSDAVLSQERDPINRVALAIIRSMGEDLLAHLRAPTAEQQAATYAPAYTPLPPAEQGTPASQGPPSESPAPAAAPAPAAPKPAAATSQPPTLPPPPPGESEPPSFDEGGTP